MCGYLNWFGDKPDERLLSNSLSGLAHRGPDDVGVISDDFAWMGFRRLSILDLSSAGHQPMLFGNGRYTLTYNGEIYNFASLRTKYLSGIDLESSGDTAVLGALLERMPIEKVLSHLRGMFSFVWYDSKEKTVTAARDHFGIKPLYYHASQQSLAIASEVRALDAATGYKFDIDPVATRDFFRWGSIQAPHTMLDGIKSLMPGHWMKWSQGNAPVTTEWFQPTWRASDDAERSPRDWVAETRETVLQSIDAHLISDVPVGVFLSGGLDSTIIASAIKKSGSQSLTAFAIGYEDNTAIEDESTLAQKTAKFIGAEFHAEIIGPKLVYDQFDAFIQSLDQPSGDALNTYLVSKLASKNFKVVLSGLGADEMFSGYTFQRAIILADKLGLRSTLARIALYPTIAKIAGNDKLSQKSAIIRRLGAMARIFSAKTVAGAHRQARGMYNEHELDRLLGPQEEQGARKDVALDPESLESLSGDEITHQLLALDMVSYLPNTLLRDNDCVSMAHSLELRVPFLDKEVFALSSRMPACHKVDRHRGKINLRKAFADFLPPWIKEEKRKKTFTLPLMKWLHSDNWKARALTTLQNPNSAIRELGGAMELDLRLHQFYSGSAHDKSNWLTSQRVWLALIYEEWCSHRESLKEKANGR